MTEKSGVATRPPDQSQTTTSSHPSSLIAVVVGGLWLCFMLWLVLTTANPVTLNREQFQRATFVVKATVDPKQKTAHVLKTWPDYTIQENIELENLPHVASSKDEYLIPITQQGEKLSVTSSRLPDEQPLIYPATDEAISQLETLLPN